MKRKKKERVINENISYKLIVGISNLNGQEL